MKKKRWSIPHTFKTLIGTPDTHTLEQRFLNGTWLFSFIAGIFSLIQNIFLGLFIMTVYSAVFTLLFGILLYLSRYKEQYKLLTWIFVALVFIAVPLAYFLNGGSNGIAAMSTLMCVILLSVLLKSRIKVYIIISLILIVFSFFYIEIEYPHLVKQYESEQLRISDAAITFLQFGLIILMIISFISKNYYREREYSVRITKQNYENQLENIKLETELKLLRQQMNPHFIYNALNSIQSYISANNTEIAERYLAKFAQLMRNILEQSREPEVLLAKEIESLTQYIELEQLRFSNKFSYTIEMDRAIDPNYVCIPSMLIQPYVENSILHGLHHKTGKGSLWIVFKKQDSIIHCTVEDDGVGRFVSDSINKSNTPKKQSLGHIITEDRIKLLNNLYQSDISIHVEDLKDSGSNASGTRVLISMPCIEKF